MKKSSIILIGLLLIAIFAFSGCVKSEAEVKAEGFSFVGGLIGLDMSFMASQPPAEIYEDADFTIALDIENKGEADVSKANVVLDGIDTEAFSINYMKDNEKIEGASQTIGTLTGTKKVGDSKVPGGRTIVNYYGTGKIVNVSTPAPGLALRATAFYPYKTTAVALVCVKENIYAQATGGSEICTLVGEKEIESSGAPLQVTYVEELPTGFNIKIENLGPGIPFINNIAKEPEGSANTEKLVSKSADLEFNELNRVRISAQIGDGNIIVKCPQQTLMLTNKEAETFCAANLGEAAVEFTDVLTITLNYGYMQSISKNIRVIDVPTLSTPA